MTQRDSRDHNRIGKGGRNFYSRLRDHRRRKDRRLLTETLEPRQLLAGPDLIGVQPNEGSLINGGEILNVSPREIVFRFDDDTQLDPSTLDGIRISRAGADGVFESATATSDLGTGGQALVEFRAKATGGLGNGIVVNFVSSSRPGSAIPLVSVNDRVVTINVNSNPANPTRVQGLISAVANHPTASNLLEVISVSGSAQTPVGTTIANGLSLTLAGANAAEATTDLGTGGNVSVRIVSQLSGADGLGTELKIERRNFFGPANPLVVVTGQSILVQLNSFSGSPSTLQNFMDAINNNPDAAALVNVFRQGGALTTPIGAGTAAIPTVTLTGVTDVVIEPGFIGLGDSPREVIFRFAEPLPDDLYQIDVLGTGPLALLNTIGEAFNDGVNETRTFSINLGPRVVAVVPEPVRRNSAGQLVPQAGKIEVHFNDDALNFSDATNPAFYQLIFTRDTVSNTDDYIAPGPIAVQYNPSTGIATLDYGRPLSRIIDPATNQEISGAARLRVGTSSGLPLPPVNVPIVADPDDTFAGATTVSIGTNRLNSVRLASEIKNTVEFGLTLPGPDSPGTRNIRPDDPSRVDRPVPLDYVRRDADSQDGIAIAGYSFPASWLGDDPNKAGLDDDLTYFNIISEQQKQRVREVMTLFSEYIGVSFYEVEGDVDDDPNVLSIALGDIYGASANATSAPGGVLADSGFNGLSPLVVMDFQDFQQSTDDQFGGEFFRGAMFAVGQLLGFGYATDLPQPNTQPPPLGDADVSSLDNDIEPSYPSIADILHGRFLHRPDSTDIDLFKFELSTIGTFTLETQAERLASPSMLDTVLRLFYETSPGEFVEVAQNNDYFSNDSLIKFNVTQTGTYVVGVSARGNSSYDPAIPNSGFGGLTQGEYELIATFDPQSTNVMTDSSNVPLDGDGDGRPGGVFDFWFEPADPTTTIYVDKEGSLSGTGTISNPFQRIDLAIAEAIRRGSDDITIRVVANGGLDGLVETAADNFSYQIGTTSIGTSLPDGRSLEVPKGVDLIIDAGVIIKFSNARLAVGSVSPTLDVSDSSLQVLGTPSIITSNGLVARDPTGAVVPGSVYFTSINDSTIGMGNASGFRPAPSPGDWGGIDFRGDLDFADASRRNRELEGVFLNHIQYADMRYGGGSVSIAGRQAVVSPIDMASTRPTIINSRIINSADAAMAATPGTFTETVFTDPIYQSAAPFTPDYSRVGPRIAGNTLIDNTINGLFVRVVTRSGDVLERITTTARFDDTDITHVLAENLIIDGKAGGPILQTSAPPTLLVQTLAVLGSGNLPAGRYTYRLTNVDRNGLESAASLPTPSATLTGLGGIRLEQLPTAGVGNEFVARRVYRSEAGSPDDFRLVATLNSSDTNYTDTVATGTTLLAVDAAVLRSRMDGSLVIDPGTVIKLDSARIEARLGAGLIAEGLPSLPIVFTSIEDQRYGSGGTFDTNNRGDAGVLNPGDWGGIYVGPAGSASIDHAVIAGGGGTTRIEGGFASFNAIEVHQGELRLANSRMEQNADGRGAPNGERVGRGANEPASLFIRAATPVIVNNEFVGNESAPMSIDVNSLSYVEVGDPGRSTGDLDRVHVVGNTGPLLQGNVLDNNAMNGLHVRGGTVATSVIWDDVDVVHIVTDTIEIPNQHVFGGLRLQSDARGSLVVKFQSSETERAGIVVGGRLESAAGEFVDIADRIGGSLQIVGHPDFPVILTTLADDSAGAGFTLDGTPGVDTNNNGIVGVDLSEQAGTLPTGPEVNRGTTIDNDVDVNVVGHFQATITDGNAIGFTDTGGGSGSGVTVQDTFTSEILVNQNYIFSYQTFVTTATGVVALGATTITQAATLIADDVVESRGSFDGPNGTVTWIATSSFDNGSTRLDSKLALDGGDNALGAIQIVSYLDEDVEGISDDILVIDGTPGQEDFRVFTLDGVRRVGFAHGGTYIDDGDKQINAVYDGWAADVFFQLGTVIIAGTQTFSVDGDIDLIDLPQSFDPDFDFQYGPGDVTTAFAWTTVATASTATVSSFLDLLPTDPRGLVPPPVPGSWEGIVIREGANDRNVVAIAELEPTRTSVVDANDYIGGGNAIPGQAQFLGELAPNEKSGDENRRLGFVVNGAISTKDELDVYSFIAESGTEVWLDIDRTSNQLDSVVELIDANGIVLASNNDSLLAETNPAALFSRTGVINPGAVQRLTVVSNRIPTQKITFSESIFDATGGTVALKISTATNFVNVNVVDLQTDPESAVQSALRSTFPQLGDFTVNQVAGNGDDLVLELTFDADQFAGRNVPRIQVDSLGVVGATVTSSVTENFAKSQLQDLYSTNEKDAGMRMILPGERGTRNLYHVRVRSSNTLDPTDFNFENIRGGLSQGAYQLQIRLRELDEFAGTQIRFADVRFATNALQIIGQPLHSPLFGEEYEISGDNDSRATAQRLGYFGAGNDVALAQAGPLQSDRLAKTFAGELSSSSDVDWYQFEVRYSDLIDDEFPRHLSTIFDLDYAGGFARPDMAFYVFNQAGELILVGGDSNISDDLPTSNQSNNTTDLSRGSAGTTDPYIGPAELIEGTYFIAISNQQNVPLPLDQFFNIDSANPLLRLEPIDSIIRIAEDRIGSFGGGTAQAPTVPLLFDSNSIIPHSLDDVLLYVNTGTSLFLVNPFTGENYISDNSGNSLGQFGIPQGITEIAFQANGELFAYTNNGPIADDGATQYVRIDTSNATATILGGTGISTFHQDPIDPPDDGSLNLSSNTGIQVNAISIASFGGIESGYFVGNRIGPTTGLQYSRNILYAFDETTGLIEGPVYANPNQVDAGAGTSPRELGHIDVDEVSSLARLGIRAASIRNNQGVTVPGLADGDTFTITPIGGTGVTFELDQGFTIVANDAPVRDGDRVVIDGNVFEFNTGRRLQLSEPVPTGSLAVGTTVAISFAGTTRTFEFVGTNTPVPGNAPISILNANGSSRSAQAIAIDFTNEVNLRFPGINADSFSSEIFFEGEPTSIVVNGTGVAILGNTTLNDPTATEVLVNETIAPDQLMATLDALFIAQAIATDRVGTQIAFPTAGSVSVEPLNATVTTGLFRDGEPDVVPGNIEIQIAPGDSVDVIRQKITDAINANNGPAQSLAGVTVDAAGSTSSSILINGGTVTATGNFVSGSQATGGTVVGIELVGTTLYALTDRGGLFTVPASRLNAPGSNGNNVSIADPVATATDLAGLNVTFTALRSGPDSVNGGSLRQMLFGITNTGDIYAFNLAGELQPVFAGGRTSISTGIFGAQGLDFSTLDYNLWHVTAQRGTDPGHGINELQNGARREVLGGNSLAFTFETGAFFGNHASGELPVRRNINGVILNPRQDGQLIEDTYNFPGGAKGVVESNPFSLEGYSAADQPVLYFNYFMETQGTNGADSLRVHVITPDGVEHLVATNNLSVRNGLADDEFDDPDRFDDIDADVQQLYDTTNSINDTWRQARVPLNDFAELSGLRLRIEFSTSGTTRTTSEGIRVVSGEVLAATTDLQFVLQSNTPGDGNQRFEFQFAPSVAFPSGPQLASLYQGNTTAATITVEGQVYLLDDGTRTPPVAPQIAINLLSGQPVGTTLADLSGADIAEAVARVVLPIGGTVPVISGVNFSDNEDAPGQAGRNDTLATATPLPYTGGNATILGDGRLGTVDSASGTVTNLDDVDLVQLTVTQGTVIEIEVEVLSVAVDQPAIRFFDSNGTELSTVTDSATGKITFTADDDGPVFIGISGAGNAFYDPNDISTLSPGDVDSQSSYTVTMTVRTLGANGNTVEFIGATQPIVVSPSGLFQVNQATGTPNTIGIPVSQFMSAREVAVAVQQAIADRFADGNADLVPLTGTSLRLGGLSIQDAGPLVSESDRFEFAAGPRAGTAQNEFEGVYLDDFIIGFAERGEIATGSNVVDSEFVPDARPNIPNPRDPISNIGVGTYQVEIRDASEYISSVDSRSVALGALASSQFRAFDTNDRLVSAGTITARPATSLRDGATFSIDDGRSTIVFEFDLEESGTPVQPGRVRVPFTLQFVDPETGIVRPQTAAEVAVRMVQAIQRNDVQNLISVSAVIANGVGGKTNPNINISGNVLVTDLGGALAGVDNSNLRGDQNRDRDAQGVIVVENSRFLFNSQHGVVIDHGLTANVAGQATPSIVRYQRNLVELNTEQIKPGVVLQSNILAFNDVGGLQINGIAVGANDTAADPVPYDRIVNNTIIGGSISKGRSAPAEEFGGILFPQGAISFADAVVAYAPGAGGTPPGAIHQNSAAALGIPDGTGFGPEPVDGEHSVSLGSGGSITLQFTDNLLTGSGDSSPDLMVFETGAVESVRVEISRDGIQFFHVGIVGGLNNTIDIDAFGFGQQDQLAFVRLTDLRQGLQTTGPVGADIDAVGAISSVPAELFFAGGIGIELTGNASPALLNNVVANSEVGVQFSATSALPPILGANSFYRNTADAPDGVSLGQFAQQIPDAEVVFFGAGDLVFVPAAGSSIIDSSIDSLEDRFSLTTVKNPLGLPPSPIIAPRLDVSGQLRVDDPSVEPPSGLGERIFKDRGASDRGDLVGPRVVLLSPPAENLGETAGVVSVARNVNAPQFFEVQLLDGLSPADVTPGTGIDDRTVTSDSVLLLKDGVLQVEGVNYRFGYNPSTNVIRLTPIAGVWEQASTYVIRMVASQDAIIQALDGSQYTDGDVLRVVDAEGVIHRFEFETGIFLTTTSDVGTGADADGLVIDVFDGTTERSFELDSNQTSNPANVRIPILETANVTEIAAAIAAAVNASGLDITAIPTKSGVQFLGDNPLASVTADSNQVRVRGAIGTSIGFGIQVPNDGAAVANTVQDGQTFTIRRGASEAVTFELDTNNSLTTLGAVRVAITNISNLDSVANAIVAAIAGTTLGLNSVNAGSGRVLLGADASYSVDLADSELTLFGTPGQGPTIPIVVGIDQTDDVLAQTIADRISGQNLPGIRATVFGTQIFLEGTGGVSGVGAVDMVTISDQVGNRVQSNQANGRTELTIFVGGGFDYGDAPYASSSGPDAARHAVDTSFALAPVGSLITVSPDSAAKLIDADDDNGVQIIGNLEPGFDSTLVIHVTNASGAPFQINAWFDWNSNGVFEPNELRTISSAQFGVAAQGQLTTPLSVPANATAGETYARFRLFRPSENPLLGPSGDALSGEVEDYRIIVDNNPFQNPNAIFDGNGSNISRFDVNNSGFVSALDALQIINALRRSGGDIDLSDLPLPSDLPLYPDVDGNGKISSLDALQVINQLGRLQSQGQSEAPVIGDAVFGAHAASTFMPVGSGVLASAATIIGDRQMTENEQDPALAVELVATVEPPTEKTSVFDIPAVIELDSIVDSLAEDMADSRSSTPSDPVDQIFASI